MLLLEISVGRNGWLNWCILFAHTRIHGPQWWLMMVEMSTRRAVALFTRFNQVISLLYSRAPLYCAPESALCVTSSVQILEDKMYLKVYLTKAFETCIVKCLVSVTFTKAKLKSIFLLESICKSHFSPIPRSRYSICTPFPIFK